MADPLLELQGAIVSHLRGDSPPLLSCDLFDRIPAGAAFPYASFGPADALTDDAECLTSYEVTLQIDVWSRAVGYPEVKTLAAEVRDNLHEAELALSENALLTIVHRQTRVFRDPDGITNHAALTFTALVEQP